MLAYDIILSFLYYILLTTSKMIFVGCMFFYYPFVYNKITTTKNVTYVRVYRDHPPLLMLRYLVGEENRKRREQRDVDIFFIISICGAIGLFLLTKFVHRR